MIDDSEGVALVESCTRDDEQSSPSSRDGDQLAMRSRSPMSLAACVHLSCTPFARPLLLTCGSASHAGEFVKSQDDDGGSIDFLTKRATERRGREKD